MITTKANNLTITLKQGEIGPAHDPYGTATLIVTRNSRKAVHYSDGLGTEYVQFWSDGVKLNELRWFDYGRNDQTRQAKCARAKEALGNKLFKQYIGVSIEDAIHQAEEAAEAYENDPFHGRDPYYGHA